MSRILWLSLLLSPLLIDSTSSTDHPSNAADSGPVVAVGGGKVPAAARTRILELAGGIDASVLVIPSASQREQAGPEGEAAWREAGATAVSLLDNDPRIARAQIAAAKVLWFGGGDQNRLMATLREQELLEPIRARNRAGAVLAGSSAGAAVMSAHMLTGKAELEAVHPGATELAEGLGVAPGVIIDQHFFARQRSNRLFAAVLDHPTEVGVGIDEGTAILFWKGTIEVIGSRQVMVIDARRASSEVLEPGRPHAARGLIVHLLREGMTPWPIAPAPEKSQL